jgi:hypothetical protein
MAIDERYFISAPLNQYMVDKDTALPLASGTITFYRDSSRTTPKAVYQLTGSPPNYTYTALPNPITLSSVGTIQNAGGDNEIIYFYPYDDDGNLDLYYIVCESSGSVAQWTREAWPNLGSGNDPTQSDFHVTNELSNCQFSRVFINSNDTTTYTISSASEEVFSFAPDWDFVLSGTGSVIVELIAISGNDDVPTNPSYLIEVTVSSGVTECFLRQRFNNNSGLFASGFLAGNFVARNEGVGTIGIELLYNESSGLTTPITIVSGSIDTTYDEQQGSVEIPDSSNTQSGDSAYVDIYLSFPTNSVSRVTSIQVVPTNSDDIEDLVPFDQISANRDQSRMGDYYIPKLEAKPIPSLLTAWDFPLNPAQNGDTQTIDGTPAYKWDQTISARVTADVAMARSEVTDGAEFTNSGATEAFYLLQYLSGAQAKKMIGTKLSVNVSAFKGTDGASATCRVYLYRAPAATAIPTLDTTIGTLATTGIFTLTAAGWTLIPRSGLDTASADLATVTTDDDLNGDIDYGFNGWEITTASEISDTDKFAIVVTFQVPTISTIVTVNSISVTPGDIPTRPAAQTPDEVLRECQYYYEMSYPNGSVPGTTISADNQQESYLAVESTSSSFTYDSVYLQSFSFNYKTKRTAPNLEFYSPTSATADLVQIIGLRNGSPFTRTAGAIATNPGNIVATTSFTETNKGVDRVIMRCQDTTTLQLQSTTQTHGDEAAIDYQFVADSRLGIV